MTRRWIFAVLPLLAACAPAPVALPPAAVQVPSGPRIVLRGDIGKAPDLVRTVLGLVPFGVGANSIALERQRGGSQFTVQLDGCSDAGCIVETGDPYRIVILRQGVSDAYPLSLVEPEWQRNGQSAISSRGWVAIPVANRTGGREIWVLDARFRIRNRISHRITTPVMMRWDTADPYLVFQESGAMVSRRISLSKGRLVSATPMDPWWFDCPGGSSTNYSAGFAGENPQGLGDSIIIPLFRRGDSEPVKLELTAAARPMASEGISSPARVTVDCRGRINIVTGLSGDIWCLRFSPDGEAVAAHRVTSGIAGDMRAIQIDREGRFYYLEVTLDDQNVPAYMHLIRLE